MNMNTVVPVLSPMESIAAIKKGQIRAVEDAISNAIETGSNLSDWIPVLEALSKSRESDAVETLAWTMLDNLEQANNPKDCLGPCGRVLRLFSKSDEFRQRAVELYQKAYSDIDSLDKLIDISGLRGGKPIRRALQTLNICLTIQPQTYLANKEDGPAAQVISIETDDWNIRLQTPHGEELFDAVTLGDQYVIAGEHNYRVLEQFNPEKLKKLLNTSPANIVIGVVEQHDEPLSSDEIELLLTPQYIPRADWSKWWNKARMALKKNPRVRLDGRNPTIIRLEECSVSLEDEYKTKFDIYGAPKSWLDVAQGYLRECKARNVEAQQSFLTELCATTQGAAEKLESEDGQASNAFEAWLVVSQIQSLSKETPDLEGPRRILSSVPSLQSLFSQISTDALWKVALSCVREVRGETWADDYVTLLPIAPPQRGEDIAQHLSEAERQDLLANIADTIMGEPLQFYNGLCWLYLGSKTVTLENVPPQSTLLARLFHVLDLANDSTTMSSAMVKEVRTRIRHTLTAQKLKRFDEILGTLETGMASAVRTQVERSSGLTDAVRSDLLSVVRRHHPKLWEQAKRVAPWEDPETLYCTRGGLTTKEAELNELVNVKLKENAIAIGRAAEHGDLSENSEYKFALEERDLLQARIAEIQNQLALARIIQGEDIRADHIGIGTTVTFEQVETKGQLTLTFLGPWEANVEEHVLNYKAPLSLRLMGRRVGEEVEIDFGGHSGNFRIAGIDVSAEFAN